MALNRKKITKNLFIILFLASISIPYLLHPKQDLMDYGAGICWDEAAYHINAKDIVKFGLPSIKEDKPLIAVFPVDEIIGIITFWLLGNSLFTLMLPYIILNIIASSKDYAVKNVSYSIVASYCNS